MIRYALRCENGHDFDSWFQSAEAYDRARSSGFATCPECGSAKVDKALMAPGVRTARKAALSEPEGDKEKALAELRKKIESESEYVGLNFAKEARAMHEGDVPHRAIYGEAKIDEAKRLIEDGVPVAPLPFTPKARVN